MLAHMQELRRQVQATQQREAQKKVQSTALALALHDKCSHSQSGPDISG